jgi:hypothetical protein
MPASRPPRARRARSRERAACRVPGPARGFWGGFCGFVTRCNTIVQTRRARRPPGCRAGAARGRGAAVRCARARSGRSVRVRRLAGGQPPPRRRARRGGGGQALRRRRLGGARGARVPRPRRTRGRLPTSASRRRRTPRRASRSAATRAGGPTCSWRPPARGRPVPRVGGAGRLQFAGPPARRNTAGCCCRRGWQASPVAPACRVKAGRA